MDDMQTKRRILERIAQVESDISALRRVRMEIATGGTASATLSSGGGSKSYTRLDLDKITSLIAELVRELRGLRSVLAGGGGGLHIGRIMTVRS